MKQYNKESETLYIKPEQSEWSKKIQSLRERKICVFCGIRKATPPAYVLCKECVDEQDYK